MKVIYAAALLLAAEAAAAQTPSAPQAPATENAWSGTIEATIGPRLGRRNPFDTTEDLVDESEHELSLTIQRDNALGEFPLSLKTGITYSPQQFDDEDPESGLYGELTLGDEYRPLHRLKKFGGGHADSGVLDALRPFASVRYTRVYRRPLDDFVRNEKQITAGLRYRNIVTLMCDRRMDPAETVGACVDEKGKSSRGISWELRGQVARIWSSDEGEERLAPSVRGDLVSHLIRRSFRLFARGQYELRFYDDALVAGTGKKREDRRLRLGVGIDVSDWLARFLPPASLEFEGQFQRRWSNDPDRRHSRFYFIPSFTLTAEL